MAIYSNYEIKDVVDLNNMLGIVDSLTTSINLLLPFIGILEVEEQRRIDNNTAQPSVGIATERMDTILNVGAYLEEALENLSKIEEAYKNLR